jgi:hypothetical protein
MMGARQTAAVLAGAMLLAGCSNALTKYEITARRPDPDIGPAHAARLDEEYRAETDYLVERRKQVQQGPPVRGENVTGIALSGGGIRSATFSLGVLQALARAGKLHDYDYLSATSGGAYTAAWMMAHYTTDDAWLHGEEGMSFAPDGSVVAKDGWEVRAASLDDLLLGQESPQCGGKDCDDQLVALQTHSRFLDKGRAYEGLRVAWAYLWRLPVSLLFDVVLHVKSDWNWYHPITIYSDRIASTYLEGLRDMPLQALNKHGGDAPYLVITANLLNSNPHDILHEMSRDDFESGNAFEFTARISGADSLGYIDTRALDALPTGKIDGPAGGKRQMEAQSQCPPKPQLSPPSPGRERAAPQSPSAASQLFCAAPLRLRDAVAAAGAAFDPEGAVAEINNSALRTVATPLGAPLNLNLGLNTWNYNSTWFRDESPLGYGVMETYERAFDPTPHSRWIKITDGGHFDNTSVYALLRRGVPTILAVDAGADPDARFHDRLRLAKIVEKRLGLTPVNDGYGWLDSETHLYSVSALDKRVATIRWLKPALDICSDPNSHLRDLARKACGFQKSEHDRFPHTTTLHQWYTIDEFEAYRSLGYAEACKILNCDGAPLPAG